LTPFACFWLVCFEYFCGLLVPMTHFPCPNAGIAYLKKADYF
jgi:hypothetical protein